MYAERALAIIASEEGVGGATSSKLTLRKTELGEVYHLPGRVYHSHSHFQKARGMIDALQAQQLLEVQHGVRMVHQSRIDT